MPIKQEITSGRVPVKIWTDAVESEAYGQLKNVANLPFVFHHVAVMPDCHVGKGAVVGSVVPTENAICPATVGVDIGCGMIAAKLVGLSAKDFSDDKVLREIRLEIEKNVPVGFDRHDKASQAAWNWDGWRTFSTLTEGVQDLKDKAMKQLGTLGGGNHFIELCLDRNNDAWVVLHSGSRNIGKSVTEVHINKAKGLIQELAIHLPDKDLAYFTSGTPEFSAYLNDLFWAQNYALMNRELMLKSVLSSLVSALHLPYLYLENRINCHHNYVATEEHFGKSILITRKGAIRAKAGDLGVIPGSMGTKSYIVKGLGNPESFDSCSHGAGRRMSRGAAKKVFTVQDLEAQTAGVECRKDSGVIDEIPGAYKDIDEVMTNQADLVEVCYELKQFLCVKG